MRNRSWLPGSTVVPLFLLGLTLPLALALAACDPDTRGTPDPEADAGPDAASPPACVAGETRAHACGRCGLETAFCEGGAWGAYGTCQEPAVCRCNAGETLSRGCGTCGTQTAACVDGAYEDFGACDEPASCGGSTCTDGQSQTQPCGACGTQTRTCFEGTWTAYGACEESPTCECVNGETNTRPCGNCGQETRRCDSGTWSAFSSCTDEGECAPGATEDQACGSDVGACQAGTQARTCADSCTWSAYGACEGGANGPVAEVCGDHIDNNCNGVTDEGCSCGAVAFGAGGSFAVAGTIRKLVADPTGCTLLALATGPSSQVVVVDTSAKAEIARIDLPFAADDIDLSPDGHTLVVSHDAIHKVSEIDLGSLSVASTFSVLSDPYQLEVSNDGRVWYAELDQWIEVHRVDLADPANSDAVGHAWPFYRGDLELSADGAALYGGESGISGGTLYRWSVGSGTLTEVDHSTWDDDYGFPYPQRQLYLSPGGHDIYYAGYQLDAQDLRFVRGHVGEPVYVGDRAEKIAVGGGHVFDARLVRSVATLSPAPTAAALVADDRELWTYAAGRLYYRNVDDFELGAQLGVRERAPGTIASYAFTRLVHDPVRPRLYGVSPSKNAVVAIDAATLQPIVEIVVGATPTDLAVDASGDSLWVGHLDVLALARIDLASLTFDRFVVMPRDTFEVEALSDGRIATVDEDQWTTVSIVDGTSGMVLASGSLAYQPALTATADGKSLFVAESGLSGSNVTRYDVSAGALTRVDESTYDSGYGFPYPARRALTLPDGSGLFYAGYRLHGSNLSILDYPMSDPILSVTPDGTRAISATKVYASSNGALRGTLPTLGTVQAVSPDGMSLFVVAGNAIVKEDLSGF